MSDRLSDSTDISDLPSSTTTISTVAVQSGRSKVILAILRGAEWIRVRVHQMEPDLTDVGSTMEEALQLRQEHNEMLAKLKTKEEEIKRLLSSADTYAVENPSQSEVYTAMAETLNEAWNELNAKLRHRSQLLEQSVMFHQSAQDFSSKMEQAQGKFSAVLPTQDVNTARHLLQQHQDIKKGILESSKNTLQLGNSLLERIREMGMHADLQNRHATTAACYGIEHLLELLQDRRRRLEDIWEQRRIRLEQCLQLCQLDQEVNKVLEWFRTVGSSYLQRTDLGDSYHYTQIIQEEHYRFESQARQIQETVLRLVRQADQLLRRSNLDAEGVKYRLQTVDRECENFMVKLDIRRKNISQAVSFFDLAETALTKLGQIEVQLNTMDLPRNSAELADRHSQLSNAIVEISTPALHEGRILLERVSRDDTGADGVRRRMTELQDRCSRLESLCKARRAEAWERSQSYLIFEEKYTAMHTWMTQIVQSTLSRHGNPGGDLASAEDFMEVHQQLQQDIGEKNAEVDALLAAGVDLVKSGDQEAHTAAEKVDTLRKQIKRLTVIVETRIQISIVYVTFHKLVQQLSNNMNGLEHILRSETEDLQDLTDSAVKHTEELWNTVSSTYNQMNDRGREFLSTSSMTKDDSTIDMRQSINTVERITSEYRERMTILSTTYESWYTHVSSSRQFKTQWHQFVQDARKTIDWVMKIENEFFPVIAGDLGSSIETANRYQQRFEEFNPTFQTIDWVMKIEREFFYPNLAGNLGQNIGAAQEMQRKCTEFMPMCKRAQEEIEKHLSTAELLSLKGDTKGQKDQIVNELIKVHQRFTARIHEYQILLKMTIQFFSNLDQLDRLIERTEREYMESELPSDLSQAETLLEEHKRKKQEVSSLINYTADEGEKIVVRVRQTDAEAAAQDDVERVLKVTAEYKQRWNQAWEEQEKRLKQNLQICQFNYDLRQIHSEIDELHHHLQARRGSYGNSLPAAKMNSQAYKQFEMTVDLIEKKIQNFTSTAELMVHDRHDDAVHINRELDMLKNKWTTFHTSVKNYRELLEYSIEYYQLYDESESWRKEANNLLLHIGRRVTECNSSQDAEQLLRNIDNFLQNGKPQQEARLDRMSQLAVDLYGDEGPSRLHQLYADNQDLLQAFQHAQNHVGQVRNQLQERESGRPVTEEIQPMEVTVTATAATRDRAPQIMLPLKDTDVMEGERVTMECHVASDTQPNVSWYKDNLPLNSPDYETRYNNGVATLTIEETFSEDTARYTCRFATPAGMTESSAHLTVRETHQQIIPPEFTRNLKSVDVLENSPFSMECHVTGIPSPTISWFKDEHNVDTSPEYVLTKINGTCCLKVRRMMRHHGARYTCRANNPGGEAASSARINVIPLEVPVIHKISEDVHIPEGKGVKLEVKFSGSPTPEVTWFRGQDRIIPSSVYKITIEINRSVLEITEAYPEDSDKYTVILKNAAGETQKSVQVNVESFYSSTAEEASQASTDVGQSEPQFVHHLPVTKEVMEGSRVRLDCVLIGQPEPEVIWYKNDKPVKESKDIQLLFEGDRCTLCIREAYLEDSAVYKCVGKNPQGTAESVCKLHVEPLSELSDASVGEVTPPKFTQLLRDYSVQAGQRVCLQCRLTGHPIPDVKWFKDNKPIDSSPDFEVTAFADVHNLTIPEAFEEDSGTYMVKAVNMVGEAKCYAKLSVKSIPEPMEAEEVMRMKRVVETKESKVLVQRDVHEQSPPEFQRLFQDKAVNAGEPVTFDCTITGTPKPKVTWFFNGQPVVSRDYQISMEGNLYRLHIPEVFDEDTGRFSITAENPSGKATCSAHLNVDEEPMPSSTKIYGSEYTSRRISHTETFTSTETRLSRMVTTSQQQQSTYVPSTEKHSTMIITDISDQQELPAIEGTEHYATTLKTDLPPKFQPVDLTIAVPVPPKFLKALKNITAMEGTRVTFEGIVTGKPEPTIKWFKEGHEITDQPDFEISYKDGRITLSIPEVFSEDEGQFMATARNVGGSASSTAELIVKASMVPPSFTEKLQPQSVKEGQPVKFTVRVAGQPAPEITWFKDGSKVVSSPDFEIIQEGDLHTMYIPEVFYEDSGKFSVMAKNPAGQVECSAELRVAAPMEEVSEEGIKPVSKARDAFEPKRTPAVFVPEKPSMSPKLQRPSAFLKEEPKPQRYKEEIGMEVTGKDLPLFEKRIPLFQTPAKEEPTSKRLAPKFTKPLKDQVVKEHHKVVFECDVKGLPEPVVKWYREGIIIPNSADYQIKFENGKCSLTIAEIFPEDSGRFKCVATNAEGSTATESTLRVIPSSPMAYEEKPMYRTEVPMDEEKVQSPTEPEQPVLIQRPHNCQLVEGGNAVFDCRVTGSPFPEIIWKKKGFPIRNDRRHHISIDERTGKVTLTISNCVPDDVGLYTVTAANFCGDTTAECILKPGEGKAPSSPIPPPLPKTAPPPPPAPRPVVEEPMQPWQQKPTQKPWEKDQPPKRPWEKPAAQKPWEQQPPAKKPWETQPQTQKPWEQQPPAKKPWEQQPPAKKPWEQQPPAQKPWQQQQPQQKPWQQPITEQLLQQEAHKKPEKGYVVTRSEKILESNLEYRRSQEPEEKPMTPSEGFRPSGFEESLMQKDYVKKDGRIKFSSETETSQSEYESEVDRSPMAQPTPPQITQKLKDFRLMEGSDATFVCRITGRPRPKVAWYLNGHRIKRSSRYEMKYTKDGYCTLRIRLALPEDAGHYTVLAVNSAGKDTCSSKLFVDKLGNIDATSFVAPETLDKILNKGRPEQAKPEDEGGILEALSQPTFKKVPNNMEVREGNTVRLDTIVAGRPVPELTWYLNGHPVPNDTHHKTVVNEDGVNSLLILGVNRYDAGEYLCVAKNKAGENKFTVHVSVLEKEQMQPPKFVERMHNLTVKEGQPVTLTCAVSGIPMPMISWQKDGKMLVPNKPYRITTDNNRSTLEIPSTQVIDSAWFQCSAANVAGTASTRAKVTVQVEPKKPEPKKKLSIPKSPKLVSPKPVEPEPEFSPKAMPKLRSAPPREAPKPKSQRTDSPPHYEIQSEGPVQQIAYVTETESATLRLVKEEDLESLPTYPGEGLDQVQPHPVPRVPPPTPASTSVESSPVPKRRRLGARPIDEVSPREQVPPMATPYEVEEPMEIEEEETMPKSVAEAKALFEVPEDRVQPQRVAPKAQPKHKIPSKPKEAVPKQKEQPLPWQKKTVTMTDQVERKTISPPGYEIQEEGFVQQISYASDSETGYLRLVSEDDIDSRRQPLERAAPPQPIDVEERRKLVTEVKILPPSPPPPPGPPKPTFKTQKVVQTFKPGAPKPTTEKQTVTVDTLKMVTLQPPSVLPKPKRTQPTFTTRAEFDSAPEIHYEIRESGPVQEIHYVSDTELGTLRLVGYSTEDEPDSYDRGPPPKAPEIPPSLQTKYKTFRSVQPPRKEKKPKKKSPSPPKEEMVPKPAPPMFAPQPPPVAPKWAPAPKKDGQPYLPRDFIPKDEEKPHFAPKPKKVQRKSPPSKPKFESSIGIDVSEVNQYGISVGSIMPKTDESEVEVEIPLKPSEIAKQWEQKQGKVARQDVTMVSKPTTKPWQTEEDVTTVTKAFDQKITQQWFEQTPKSEKETVEVTTKGPQYKPVTMKFKLPKEEPSPITPIRSEVRATVPRYPSPKPFVPYEEESDEVSRKTTKFEKFQVLKYGEKPQPQRFTESMEVDRKEPKYKPVVFEVPDDTTDMTTKRTRTEKVTMLRRDEQPQTYTEELEIEVKPQKHRVEAAVPVTDRHPPSVAPKPKKKPERPKKTRFAEDVQDKPKERPRKRSDTDSLFTESDSDAPDWAYVSSKVKVRAPEDIPKKLVIDIEPLKLTSIKPETPREPVRAPEVPREKRLSEAQLPTWSPDQTVVQMAVDELEKMEERLDSCVL
ncbi:hypothetical protein FSP39_014900 [Pinctada imbricata]|uniref:Ig-like domain-containing protein n=1 Tax=Pinctada imbricata TaxID=66713 RepID=A0AA88XHV3_PINIB|nr:hypothetical protein FSP39_014900 [Pinctada imbricata]